LSLPRSKSSTEPAEAGAHSKERYEAGFLPWGPSINLFLRVFELVLMFWVLFGFRGVIDVLLMGRGVEISNEERV
jgi:hypothetical protein